MFRLRRFNKYSLLLFVIPTVYVCSYLILINLWGNYHFNVESPKVWTHDWQFMRYETHSVNIDRVVHTTIEGYPIIGLNTFYYPLLYFDRLLVHPPESAWSIIEIEKG